MTNDWQHSERVSLDDRPDLSRPVSQHERAAPAGGPARLTSPATKRALGPASEHGDGAATGRPLPLIKESLQAYLAARQAQELDHTNAALCQERREAHDELLWELALAGVECEDRDDAIEAAQEWLEANEEPEMRIPCEVYSRVVGYLRPVQDWHEGKKQEFEDRVVFQVPDSALAATEETEGAVSAQKIGEDNQ